MTLFPLYLKKYHVVYWLLFILNAFLLNYSFFIFCVLYVAINELMLWYIFGKPIPAHYRPYECFENEHVKLYYTGDMPILEFKNSLQLGYFDKGVWMGRLLHQKMIPLVWKFYPLFLFQKYFRRHPPMQCEEEEAKLPFRYFDELRGLVSGYNESVSPIHRITLHYAYAWHLLPDLYSMMACSTLVFQDKQNNGNESPIVARHLDFCGFGSGGGDSLVIVDGDIRYLTIPGMIGVATGWKSSGLITIINVAHNHHYKHYRGCPMMFLTRMYLETCNSTKEVLQRKQEFENSGCVPWASFHLTVCDKKESACISYRQIHEYKEFDCSGDVIQYCNQGYFKDNLYIFNFTYGQHMGNKNTSDSLERKECVLNYMKFFDNRRPTMDDIKSLIQSPILNVFDTLHSCIFNLESGEIYISKDNQFAASNENGNASTLTF